MLTASVTTIDRRKWERMVKSGKSFRWLADRYHQPAWCVYPDALNGLMGCWSLVSKPYEITEARCRRCDCHVKPAKGASDDGK